MKILILATPRSGSTTLSSVISTILKYFWYVEPYNYGPPILAFRVPLTNLPENIVVKSMFNQVPKNSPKDMVYAHRFYKEEIKKFDKVIILCRKDILSAYESYNFKVKTDPKGDWHKRYIYKDVEFDNRLYSQYTSWCSNLLEFAYNHDLPITWHEDIFNTSTERLTHTVESWGLGITTEQVQEKLKNFKKYRATEDKRTLI